MGKTITWEYHYNSTRESACKYDGGELTVTSSKGEVLYQREYNNHTALYPGQSSYQVLESGGRIRTVELTVLPTLQMRKCMGSGAGTNSRFRALVLADEEVYFLIDRIQNEYSAESDLEFVKVLGQELEPDAWTRSVVGELILVYRQRLPLDQYPDFGYKGGQLHRYRLLRLKQDTVVEVTGEHFDEYEEEIEKMLTSVQLNRTLPQLSTFEKFFNRAYQRYCYRNGKGSYSRWYSEQTRELVGYDVLTFSRAENWLELIKSQDCDRIQFSLE